ncbi:MAG TPA: dTDP-glucose 4,6-dehydratase [Steroidobacteraceae bacterium]|nr:dTDP-glucose 4,6-dehydratase [Steroidobacteraceae bacterium]
MRRLLVTGGAGFIGSNFVHYWLGHHPDDSVTVLDALTYAGNRASLKSLDGNPRLEFVQGDICDAALVWDLLVRCNIDTIVHFAAESHVDRSIVAPDVFIRTNVLGTHTLLEAARQVWLQRPAPVPHRFHHVSTDEVYGSLGPTDPAFTEAHPYAPNSPYAASKAASDHLVRAYHHTYGLATTVSNCSNNYGPYHFPEKLIPLAIVNILHGKALPIYGDGRNVRDWLYVTDHCRGIDLILQAGRPGSVYNIGGRAESENLQLVQLLCNVADATFAQRPDPAARFPAAPAARGARTAELITFVKDRPGHDRRYAIDSHRIERDLGFRASISLEAGLRRTFLWYLDNEDWWRGVMDGSYRNWMATQYGS